MYSLSRSIGQIIAFDKGTEALVNALVLDNLCEYHHKLYIAENSSDYNSVADNVGLYSCNLLDEVSFQM